LALKDRLRKKDDDWALFPGVVLGIACLVAVGTVVSVGFFGVGDHDKATREAVVAVGGPAAGAFLVLGLVTILAISGRWSPTGWFYAGVLFQGLYIAKFYFGIGMAAERVGMATVLVSGVCFALDCVSSAGGDVRNDSCSCEPEPLAR
jgi:hypothetical protein